MLALDTRRLREKALKDCAKAAEAFEKDDRALKAFEQGDTPAFERWKHQRLGPLLAELQQLDQELMQAEALYDIALHESWAKGIPPWKALEQWRKDQERRRNDPEPEPPPDDPPDDARFDVPEEDDPDFDEQMKEFIRNSPLGRMAEALGIDLDDLPSGPPPGGGFHARSRAEGPPHRAKPDASLRDLYRQLCRLLHPDAAGEMTPARRELWHQVQDAYEARDAARLDTLLARLERADGLEIRPRTVAEILGMKKHYERARQQLRALLRRARRNAAWGFLQRDEKSRAQLEREARGVLAMQLADVQHQLEEIRRTIEPPKARPARPRTRKTKPVRFGPDELFG